MRFAWLLCLAACDRVFLSENPVDAAAAPDAALECSNAFMGQRYVFISDQVPWLLAEQRCGQLSSAGQSHLAVVNDLEERTLLDQLREDREHWVGLSNRAGGAFQWVTAEPTLPVDMLWAPGQPNGGLNHCGSIVAEGLRDDQCSATKRFVCECDQFPSDPTRF